MSKLSKIVIIIITICVCMLLYAYFWFAFQIVGAQGEECLSCYTWVIKNGSYVQKQVKCQRSSEFELCPLVMPSATDVVTEIPVQETSTPEPPQEITATPWYVTWTPAAATSTIEPTAYPQPETTLLPATPVPPYPLPLSGLWWWSRQ